MIKLPIEERRKLQLEAALTRKNAFKQGGLRQKANEKLKIENKKNHADFDDSPQLDWRGT